MAPVDRTREQGKAQARPAEWKVKKRTGDGQPAGRFYQRFERRGETISAPAVGPAAGPGKRGFKAQPTELASPRQVVIATESSAPQRLHKVMANAGIAARRRCEELIQAGRVRVNGQVVTQLGTKVTAGVDRIEVDGRALGPSGDRVYLLMNKPIGYVTTLHDPGGRPKVVDLLGDLGARVYPVGRLDFDSEGLLLLTTDGELTHALTHPSRQVSKTYVARVRGIPSESKLRQLAQGIELEDGITAPAQVRMLRARTDPANPRRQSADVELSIHEGRNRQVRRMMEAVGHEVISLRRTRIGPLRLEGLAPGGFRPLRPDEVAELRLAAGLSPTAESGTRQRPGNRPPRPAGPRSPRFTAKPGSRSRPPGAEVQLRPGQPVGRRSVGAPAAVRTGQPARLAPAVDTYRASAPAPRHTELPAPRRKRAGDRSAPVRSNAPAGPRRAPKAHAAGLRETRSFAAAGPGSQGQQRRAAPAGPRANPDARRRQPPSRRGPKGS